MVNMVSVRILVQPLVVLLTLKGVTGQWGGVESMVGPGFMGGGGFGMELGGGMGGGMGQGGVGGSGVGRSAAPRGTGGMGMPGGFPLMSLDQLAEYNEMPYFQRPLAARIASAQWRSQMPSMLGPDPLQGGSTPTVTEKPKRYMYPRLGNEPKGPVGPDKHAWKKLKATFDKTLSVFPTQQRNNLKQIHSRFTQEPAHPTQSNVKTHYPASGFQSRPPHGPHTHNTHNAHNTHNTHITHNTHTAPHPRLASRVPGSHFTTNVKPYAGPTHQSLPTNVHAPNPQVPSSPQSVSPSAGGVLNTKPQPSTGVKYKHTVPVYPAFQQTSVSQQNQPNQTQYNSMPYQGSGNIPTKQSSAFTSRGIVQSGRPVASSSLARTGSQASSVRGVSQPIHKPASGLNQLYVQSNTGLYNLQGIKAPDVGYNQFGQSNSAIILNPNPNPQIESMRQAVQNGASFGTVLKSNKTAGIVSTMSPSTAAPQQTKPRAVQPPTPLDALTQAAEGPSIFNLNSVKLNGVRIRSGIPDAIPDSYISVTSSPYLDAGNLYGMRQAPQFTTQSWGYASPVTYYPIPQTGYPDYFTQAPYYQGYYEFNPALNQVASGTVGSDYIHGGLVLQQSQNSLYQMGQPARKITTLTPATSTLYDPTTRAPITQPTKLSSTTQAQVTQPRTTSPSTSQTTSTQPPTTTSGKLTTQSVSMLPSSKKVEEATPLPTQATPRPSPSSPLLHMSPRSQKLNPERASLYRDRQVNIRPEYLLQRDRYRAVWNVRPNHTMGQRPSHIKPNPNPRFPLRQPTTEGTSKLITSTAELIPTSTSSTAELVPTTASSTEKTIFPSTADPTAEPTAIPTENSSTSATTNSSVQQKTEGPPAMGTVTEGHNLTKPLQENATSSTIVQSSSYQEVFSQRHQQFDAQIQNMDRLEMLAQENVDSQTRKSVTTNPFVNTHPTTEGLSQTPKSATPTATTSIPVPESTTRVTVSTATASSSAPLTTIQTPTTVTTTSPPTTSQVNVLDTEFTTSHYTDYLISAGRNPTLIGQSLVLAQNRFDPRVQGHLNVRGRIELSDQMQFSGNGEPQDGHLALKQMGSNIGITVKPVLTQQPTIPPGRRHPSLPRRSSFINNAQTMRQHTPMQTSIRNMSGLYATPAPKFPLNTRTTSVQYQYPQRAVQPLRAFPVNKQTMANSQRFGSQAVLPRNHFPQRQPVRVHPHRVTQQPSFRRRNFTKPTFPHKTVHNTFRNSLHKGLHPTHNFMNHPGMTRVHGLKPGLPTALGGQGNPRHSSKVTTRPVPGTHRANTGRKNVPYTIAASVQPAHPPESVQVRNTVSKTRPHGGKPTVPHSHPSSEPKGRPGHPSATRPHLKHTAPSPRSPPLPQRPPSRSNAIASTEHPRGQLSALNSGISKLASAILTRQTQAVHHSTIPRAVGQKGHHHTASRHPAAHPHPRHRSMLPQPAPTSAQHRPLLYSTLGSFTAAAKTHQTLRVGNPANQIKLTSANPRPQHPTSGKLEIRQMKTGQPTPRAIQPKG
ncbi:flocculation protein FLO11-like isoform X2 [Haliotis rufescens]|uniref:flocculation protein FLO11-like isoform X2 n=1 Tax=Haliotis rufescens TaxID=6454 RepID=UPI00201F7645|nr:flocculation protein FLO11-like isoform X2 [Haliotis rufescens]